MSKRLCKVHPDRFCYICGELIISNKGYPLTESLKEAYLCYFKISVSHQDKNCRKTLSSWATGAKRFSNFNMPMI